MCANADRRIKIKNAHNSGHSWPRHMFRVYSLDFVLCSNRRNYVATLQARGVLRLLEKKCSSRITVHARRNTCPASGSINIMRQCDDEAKNNYNNNQPPCESRDGPNICGSGIQKWKSRIIGVMKPKWLWRRYWIASHSSYRCRRLMCCFQ